MGERALQEVSLVRQVQVPGRAGIRVTGSAVTWCVDPGLGPGDGVEWRGVAKVLPDTSVCRGM